MVAVIRNEVRRIFEEVAEFCRNLVPDSSQTCIAKKGEKWIVEDPRLQMLVKGTDGMVKQKYVKRCCDTVLLAVGAASLQDGSLVLPPVGSDAL